MEFVRGRFRWRELLFFLAKTLWRRVAVEGLKEDGIHLL